jgi:muramoyltetrapeptide carboxypeptidase LdcA involved in peptidoglycan recycling
MCALAITQLADALFTPMNIPIVTGFPLGHGSENTTLPLGVPAELDTEQPALTLLETAVI